MGRLAKASAATLRLDHLRALPWPSMAFHAPPCPSMPFQCPSSPFLSGAHRRSRLGADLRAPISLDLHRSPLISFDLSRSRLGADLRARRARPRGKAGLPRPTTPYHARPLPVHSPSPPFPGLPRPSTPFHCPSTPVHQVRCAHGHVASPAFRALYEHFQRQVDLRQSQLAGGDRGGGGGAAYGGGGGGGGSDGGRRGGDATKNASVAAGASSSVASSDVATASASSPLASGDVGSAHRLLLQWLLGA